MKQVTEKMKPQKEWFKKAHEVKSIDDIVSLAKELFEETQHDYGTVCHAVAALALAGAWYGCQKEGITGFQAGFVMWDFIREWEFSSNKTGLRLTDFDDMLYPQNESKFEKTISKSTWKALQEEAAKMLKENFAVPAVKTHWQSIVDGKVPFGYKIKED